MGSTKNGVVVSGCYKPMVGTVKAKNLRRHVTECARRQGWGRTVVDEREGRTAGVLIAM